MQILKCQTEDIVSVSAFYDSVVAWLDAHINYPKWEYQVYPSEGFVRAMTEERSQYLCLEDGRIIGAFILNTDPQGNYENGSWQRDIPRGSYMIIHTLAIDPEMHGQGIASAVIAFCEETAKLNGYQALRADVVPENVPARQLYEKNGFSYAGDTDLERGIEDIPLFSLYEKNWQL